MLVRWVLVSVFTFMLFGCSTVDTASNQMMIPPGITFIEKSDLKASNIGIPYSKYQLSNGLTIILSPDHSDPLVRVDVTYHVGSSRETIGHTGFAHFFEHMMFEGSKHVGAQQHFRMITEAGGILNGSTNRDRTNYYETVPSNQLEKVLWLESDRMGFLLDSVSQHKFEIQRKTVKNERTQHYESQPYGLIWEKMDEAMYPSAHPYSWQPIGYVEDLDRVNVKDLQSFFLRWYGPNNAVLTIGGDINISQTLAWVKKYFGTIPKGPDVKKQKKRPVLLPADRFITVSDHIQQPMIVIGWPTEYRGGSSETSLDVLAQILGSGNNSLLYQKLVKTQKVFDAGAFQKCGELSCSFYLYAVTSSQTPGKLKSLKNEMMSIVHGLETRGINLKRLSEIKGMAYADAVFSLESVAGKVSQLASNQTYFSQPDRINEQLDQLSNVSADSIHHVLTQFLLGHPKVVMSVVPQGKETIAVRSQNYVFHRPELSSYNLMGRHPVVYREPRDTFDRSKIPQVSQAVKPMIPRLYSDYLDNGIEIMGTEFSETPTVLIQITLPAGERYVPHGKEGLAQLTSSLLQEGTLLHSSEQVESQLDQLGSVISVSTGTYTSRIIISSLKKNVDSTLAILSDILSNPKFSLNDFNRMKKQMIQDVLYRQTKMTWLASQASRQVLYHNTIFERDSDGTVSSINALTLDDVKQFFNNNYTPNGTQISVVGDMSKKEAVHKLKFLNNWKGKPAPLLAPQRVTSLKTRKVYLVDKPNGSQSIIRFVRLGMRFDATGDMFLTQLANFNLAGNFNSRMNLNLRERKGFTYGMSGYVASNREVGTIVFDASVRQDVTLDAIREMKNDMENYATNGVTDSEMQFMKLAVGQQDVLAYETPVQKAQLINGIMTYSLDPGYLEQRNDIVANVSKQTINRLAKKWFNPNDYQIIVVGDAKKLRSQLEKLNLPIVALEIRH